MAKQTSAEIRKILSPVVGRFRLRQALACGSLGLAVGAAIALGCAAVYAVLGGWGLMIVGLGALLTLPIAGAVWGYLQPVTHVQAAKAVDAHFRLQDRTVTALEAGGGSLSPAQQITLQDALGKLRSIKPAQAAPIGRPQHFATSIVLAVVALLLFFFPWDRIAPPVTFTPSPAGDPTVVTVPTVSAAQVPAATELRPYQNDESIRTDPASLEGPIVQRYFAKPSTEDAAP